jgi:hypothetical protein
MSQFIVVTRMSLGVPDPGLRLAVAHIVAYRPVDGGTVLVTSEGCDDWWTLADSCEEIDALIAGPGMFARPPKAEESS